MVYRISGELEPLSEKDLPLRDGVMLEILTVEEYKKRTWELPHQKVLERNLEAIRFCKAEILDSCVIGTLKIPLKQDVVNRFLTLTYYMQKDRLLMITRENNLENVIRDVRQMKVVMDGSIGHFFSEFLQYFIQNDVAFLVRYEDRLLAMEDGIFESSGRDSRGLREFQAIRKGALRMSTYYQEMIDMLEMLYANENQLFSDEEVRYLRLLCERCRRLYDLTRTVREYCLQLRELSQSVIQTRQNANMATLTVVTAIFLPLTLIVGWYGMNFTNMPEYDLQYGYIGIIIISVIIVVAEIIFFRKKHYFE